MQPVSCFRVLPRDVVSNVKQGVVDAIDPSQRSNLVVVEVIHLSVITLDGDVQSFHELG